MNVRKNGISLIVLVITIIVLAILAATVIVSIINVGIINSAKDSVAEHQLGQVRDLVAVAWSAALVDSNVTTSDDYINYIINFLKDSGYTTDEIDKYDITASSNGVTVYIKENDGEASDELEYAGITITSDTEGVTFTKEDGITLGDVNNIESGDIVIYGDYEYRYNQYFWETDWVTDTNQNGWGVRLNADSFEKTTVDELCGSIYGQPLVTMDHAYAIATYVMPASNPDSGSGPIQSVEQIVGANIQSCPKIPESVTSMACTFYACANLKEAPVIPATVKNLHMTFAYCNNLSNEMQINSSSVTNMEFCFFNIPNSLTVKVPANSITYTTISTANLGSDKIAIVPFDSKNAQ